VGALLSYSAPVPWYVRPDSLASEGRLAVQKVRIPVGALALILFAVGCQQADSQDSVDREPAPTTSAPPSSSSTPPSSSTTTTLSGLDQRRAEEAEERARIAAATESVLVAYHEALAAKDGARAVELLSSRSLEWFDEILDLAQNADFETLEAAPTHQFARAVELRALLGEGVHELTSGAEAHRALVDAGFSMHFDFSAERPELVVTGPPTNQVWDRWSAWKLWLEDDRWLVDVWYVGSAAYPSVLPDEDALEILTGNRVSRLDYFTLLEEAREGFVDFATQRGWEQTLGCASRTRRSLGISDSIAAIAACGDAATLRDGVGAFYLNPANMNSDSAARATDELLACAENELSLLSDEEVSQLLSNASGPDELSLQISERLFGPCVAAPSGGELFTDPQGTYTIAVDPTWVERHGISTADTEFWVIDESSSEFSPTIQLSTALNPTELSLEDYLEASIAGTDLILDDFILLDSGTVSGESDRALGMMEFQAVTSGLNLHFLVFIGLSDDHAVVATLTASPETFEEYRVILEPYLLTLTPTP